MATRKKSSPAPSTATAPHEAWVDAWLEHLLAQPLRAVVPEPAKTANWLCELATRENLERIHTRHIRPGWPRLLERTRTDGLRPADLVDPALRAEVDRRLGELRLPKAAWAQNALQASTLRNLLSPVAQETLLQFARKLSLPGMGGHHAGAAGAPPPSSGGRLLGGVAKGLMERVERRAERVAEVGKGVLGGLGIDLEAKARELSSAAMDDVRHAFVARLREPEAQRMVGQLRSSLLDAWLHTPAHALLQELDALPLLAWLELHPRLLATAAAHPRIRAGVEAELGELLRIEGDRTLRELLTEAGALDATIALVRPVLVAQSAAFFASAPGAAWLAAQRAAD